MAKYKTTSRYKMVRPEKQNFKATFMIALWKSECWFTSFWEWSDRSGEAATRRVL